MRLQLQCVLAHIASQITLHVDDNEEIKVVLEAIYRFEKEQGGEKEA